MLLRSSSDGQNKGDELNYVQQPSSSVRETAGDVEWIEHGKTEVQRSASFVTGTQGAVLIYIMEQNFDGMQVALARTICSFWISDSDS